MGSILGVLLVAHVVDVIQELLPGFEGTIPEAEDFEAEADAVALEDAIGRGRIDDDVVNDILPNRSNAQRQEIQEQFQSLFGESLYDRVNDRVRRDRLRHVIKGMLLTPMQYDARCLNQAMKGIGSSDDDVIGEILCARPNGYIEQLKEVYEERYGNALADDIENNCRREFERFMLAILCCAREEGLDAIDEDQAAEDAQELFDAGEDRWFFTDESVFTRICARRSWMQIRLINHKYQEISEEYDLLGAIENEVDGDLKRAYKAIVRMALDPAYFFARNAYKALKGLGTDDDALQRAVIFTSEWALQTVKEKYEESFGSSLADDIDGDCSGDYKDMLLAIVK